jgi:Zn-dependent M28 family amino/carboxypeptidase
MLETARIVAVERPDAPVEFVGFNLEELSMVGSSHYATQLKRRRVPLLGMLSLEMVGFTESRGEQRYPPFLSRRYPRVGNFIGLAANHRSNALLRLVATAMRSVPDLPVETLVVPANGWLFPEARLSDHSPFWDNGYPALLVTDTAFFRNPHYHQPTDTVDTLDAAFLDRVCQGVVEAVRALSQQIPC